jgi:hypothetical protein
VLQGHLGNRREDFDLLPARLGGTRARRERIGPRDFVRLAVRRLDQTV